MKPIAEWTRLEDDEARTAAFKAHCAEHLDGARMKDRGAAELRRQEALAAGYGGDLLSAEEVHRG